MMAESNSKLDHGVGDSNHLVETKEPACFDFLEKAKVDEVMKEPQKEDKEDLRRPHSQSSSPDDEELESERKKNKKDDKNEDDGNDIQVVDVVVDVHEKKGFLDTIKAHLPGQHKTEEDGKLITKEKHRVDGSPKKETEEKKRILEKIKDKFHKNGEGQHDEKKKDN